MDRGISIERSITNWETTKDYSLNPLKRDEYPIVRPTVSVIIPTLNEAKNLPLVLPYLPTEWIDEVLLVDGRSSDGTIDIARQILPSIKIVMEQKKGKGAAMYAGYQAASGDILIVMDADGSNDPREIPRYIKPLLEGADFVKGSRFAPGGGTTDMPRLRKWGNGGFVTLSNMLFGTNFTDLCYGFHAFWRHCLGNFQLENVDGFEIDTVLYLQAQRRKLRIVEVPSFEGYRFFGEGKLQTIPDGVRVLKMIFKEWLAAINQGQPELFLGFRGYLPGSNSSFLMQDILSRASQSKLDLQLLQLFSRMLFSGFGLNEALKRVLQLTSKALDAHSGSIVMLDDNGAVKQVCLEYKNELRLESSNQITEIIQQGLAGWVIRNRQPALVNNTREDPRWFLRDWDTCCMTRSALAVPIIADSRVFAVLTLTRPEARHFTENDLQVLNGLGLSY